MEYYWSFVLGENWYYGGDSVAKCLEIASETNQVGPDFGLITHEYVYIGEIDYYKPSVDEEAVVERLIDNAYSDCGECSQAWLGGVSANNYASLEKKLNKAVYEWLEEIDEMPFFGEIANIKKYDLETGEIVKEARR